jgi:uncharacterized protein
MEQNSLQYVLNPFHRMSDEERLEQVRQLLAEDPQRAHQPDSGGTTPLYWAANWGWFEIVHLLLLDYHADPNVTTPQNGQTPLSAATNFNGPQCRPMMELLLTHGADPNRASRYGWIPLYDALRTHYSSEDEALAIFELLLEHGARVKLRGAEGRTLLHENHIHPGAVPLLLAHGADINARDAEGRTPLHIVAWEGLEKVVAALIECGAEVNAPDKQGRTPLFYALTMRVRVAKAKRLLEAGANPNVADEEGNTPLHQAAGAHLTAGVEMLLEAGAEVNARNKKRRTPLKVLLKEGYAGEDDDYVLYTNKAEKNATKQEVAEILRAAGGVEV